MTELRLKFIDKLGNEVEIGTIRGDPSDLIWLSDCLINSVKCRKYENHYLYQQPMEVPLGLEEYSNSIPSIVAPKIGIKVNIIPDEEDD